VNNLKSISVSEGDSSSTGTGGTECAGVSRTRSGKVNHDSRGNAVWDWGMATGVFARVKATELLSMLDNPTLALEGECAVGAADWAGDPYNRR
jgi:hypothetical protein